MSDTDWGKHGMYGKEIPSIVCDECGSFTAGMEGHQCKVEQEQFGPTLQDLFQMRQIEHVVMTGFGRASGVRRPQA